MEIIAWIIGILLVLGFVGWLIEVVKDWSNSIDWVKFLGTLILGGIALAVIFSFTAEGVLVIVGAYFVLIIVSLTFGAFKKSNVFEESERY